jgi:Helix-turn-helix domain
VSALLNYRLEGISVERLMSFLTALHQDIEIVIRGRTGLRRNGKIVVRAA